MKKIFLILTLLFFPSLSNANDLTLVVPGTAGGTWFTLMNTLKSDISSFGNVDVKVSGGCLQAYKIWNSSNKKMITVASTNSIISAKDNQSFCNFIPSKDNFIGLSSIQYYMLSTNLDKDFDLNNKNQTIVIGYYARKHDQTWLTDLSSKLNILFKLVPYKSTGDVVKGLISKEIDIAFMNSNRTLQGVKEGILKVLYTTGTEDFPSIQSILPDWKDSIKMDIQAIVSKNLSNDEINILRKLYKNSLETGEVGKLMKEGKVHPLNNWNNLNLFMEIIK